MRYKYHCVPRAIKGAVATESATSGLQSYPPAQGSCRGGPRFPGGLQPASRGRWVGLLEESAFINGADSACAPAGIHDLLMPFESLPEVSQCHSSCLCDTVHAHAVSRFYDANSLKVLDSLKLLWLWPGSLWLQITRFPGSSWPSGWHGSLSPNMPLFKAIPLAITVISVIPQEVLDVKISSRLCLLLA